MSYDMSINDKEFNLTWNVAPMLYKHNKKGIRGLYDLNGRDGGVFLLDMINYFIDNKVELEALNPENGWGSYENTLDCLFKMFKASLKNQESIWKGD